MRPKAFQNGKANVKVAMPSSPQVRGNKYYDALGGENIETKHLGIIWIYCKEQNSKNDA